MEKNKFRVPNIVIWSLCLIFYIINDVRYFIVNNAFDINLSYVVFWLSLIGITFGFYFDKKRIIMLGILLHTISEIFRNSIHIVHASLYVSLYSLSSIFEILYILTTLFVIINEIFNLNILSKLPKYVFLIPFALYLADHFLFNLIIDFDGKIEYIFEYIIPTLFINGHLASQLCFIGLLLTNMYFLYPKGLPDEWKEINNSSENTTNNTQYRDGYISLAKHVLLLLFTCGIWYFIWIYKTTVYLNKVKDEEYRNPTNKLLLCIFVPFYIIYWVYKSAQRIDKLGKENNVQSDLTALCLILAIFVAIIPPILMQSKINDIATGNNKIIPPTDTVEELKKYKDLLDSGVITQEEFDQKKKQLLGL